MILSVADLIIYLCYWFCFLCHFYCKIHPWRLVFSLFFLPKIYKLHQLVTYTESAETATMNLSPGWFQGLVATTGFQQEEKIRKGTLPSTWEVSRVLMVLSFREPGSFRFNSRPRLCHGTSWTNSPDPAKFPWQLVASTPSLVSTFNICFSAFLLFYLAAVLLLLFFFFQLSFATV